MKPIATFNRIFVNVSKIFLSALLILPIVFTMDAAAATFRCTAKPIVYKDGSNSQGQNIVRVTIKGDGVTSAQFSTAKVSSPSKTSGAPPVTPTTGGTIVSFSQNASSYIQGEQMSIYAYKPWTQELIEEVANCKYTWNRTPTTAAPVTTTPPPAPTLPVLPVEFVKTSTVASDSQISITIKNNSTDTFEIEVLVGWAAGNSVVTTWEKTTIAGGATAQKTFYDGIRKGEVYNFTMIGKKVGATTKYQNVKYDGIKASGTPQTTTTPTTTTATTDSGPTSGAQSSDGRRDPLTGTISIGDGTCGDGKDNDGDGKYDWDGVAVGGIPQYPPDPACVNKDMTESADDVAEGSWIPCTNKCDLPGVFALLNNLITKLITVILFPVVIIMFVYAGYKYITAQGNSSKKADIKRMLGHIILGMVIILTAWLVVKTVLLVLGYDQTLYFFQE